MKVPLDWSGRVAGSISLNVEVEKGVRSPRGVMFLVAGGPGQAATQVFDVGDFGFWSRVFPGYRLVAFDDRGTGNSGPLGCGADAQHGSDAKYGAGCARLVGPKRVFYSTEANAMDIDAVRRALGYSRISIFGVSYGTDLALAYAAAFPDRVQRIVLDSVSDLAAWPGVLAHLPGTLREYCAHVCAGVTSDFGGDVVALANALERRPVRGTVLAPDGGRAHELLTAQDLVYLAVETDLDPGLAAALPAAVQAARLGDAAPLLRLEQLVETTPALEQQRAANAVYVSTDCDDGPFPWQPDTPLAQRITLEARSFAEVSSASIGGFGRWALAMRTGLCLRWPQTNGSWAPAAVSYPDVPVLVIAGDLDVRGTMAQARAVVARFPRARLLTLTNAGHSAVTTAPPGCLERAIARWLAGRSPASRCTSARLLAPLGIYPPITAGRAWRSPRSALELAGQTLRDAEAVWLLTQFEDTPRTVAGLVSGRLRSNPVRHGFTLNSYGIVAGLALTRKVDAVYREANTPPRFTVGLFVEHDAATIGELTESGRGFEGSLDGRLVVAGKLGGRANPRSPAFTPPNWSTWKPPAGSTAEITREIASRVEAEYRLDSRGARLDRVVSQPTEVRGIGLSRLTEIDLERPQGRSSTYDTTNVFGQPDTRSYELCGAGPNCTIRPGQPTVLRGDLVRREGLELALDTFTFEPSVSSVIVYLPPAFSFVGATELLYFQRGQLARELARPLRATLPLARPPLPTSPDSREQATIARATLPATFSFFINRYPSGGTVLGLNPLG